MRNVVKFNNVYLEPRLSFNNFLTINRSNLIIVSINLNYKKLVMKDFTKRFILSYFHIEKSLPVNTLNFFFNVFTSIKYGYFVRFFFSGIGFKCWKSKIKNNIFLVFDLGYTNYFFIKLPKFIILKFKKYEFLIFGFSKLKLHLFARILKNLRFPDNYKGKGVRLFKEKLVFKTGKVR